MEVCQNNMLRWIVLSAVEPTHRIVTPGEHRHHFGVALSVELSLARLSQWALVARAIVNVRGAVALNSWIAAVAKRWCRWQRRCKHVSCTAATAATSASVRSNPWSPRRRRRPAPRVGMRRAAAAALFLSFGALGLRWI